MTDQEANLVAANDSNRTKASIEGSKIRSKEREGARDRAAKIAAEGIRGAFKLASANDANWYVDSSSATSKIGDIYTPEPSGVVIPSPQISDRYQMDQLNGLISRVVLVDTIPHYITSPQTFANLSVGGVATIPDGNEISSQLHMIATELWSTARSANAGFTNTTPAELEYYIFMLAHFVGLYHQFSRAYKVLCNYDSNNRLKPILLFNACVGTDMSSVSGQYHASVTKATCINLYNNAVRDKLMIYQKLVEIARLLNSLNIPNMAIIARKAFLYGNVFKDDESEKCSLLVPYNNFLFYGDTLKDVDAYGVSDIPSVLGGGLMNDIDSLIASIRRFMSTQINVTISGDLAKTAKSEYIPSDKKFTFITLNIDDLDNAPNFIFDFTFLQQIQNIHVCTPTGGTKMCVTENKAFAICKTATGMLAPGLYKRKVITPNSTFFITTSLGYLLYPDGSAGILTSAPNSWSEAINLPHLLDPLKDEMTVGDAYEITRLISYEAASTVKNYQEWNYNPSTGAVSITTNPYSVDYVHACNTEIVLAVDYILPGMFRLDSRSGSPALTYPALAEDSVYTVRTSDVLKHPSYFVAASGSHTITDEEEIALAYISQFQYHPRLRISGLFWTNSSGPFWSHYSPIGDLVNPFWLKFTTFTGMLYQSAVNLWKPLFRSVSSNKGNKSKAFRK